MPGVERYRLAMQQPREFMRHAAMRRIVGLGGGVIEGSSVACVQHGTIMMSQFQFDSGTAGW